MIIEYDVHGKMLANGVAYDILCYAIPGADGNLTKGKRRLNWVWYWTRIGIRAPKDLRLVGFDNVRFASLLSTPHTTIEQPVRDIAVTAFRAV